MKLVVTGLMIVLLAACSTPYGKYGMAGGYSDTRIDENTFSVSVDTNGYTSQQTTSMHALYRAAELTVDNGFDFFVVSSGTSNSNQRLYALPELIRHDPRIRSLGQGLLRRRM